MSELGDLIIGTQRWMVGNRIPERLRLIDAADLNALRDELIELRAIAAKTESDQGRIDVMADADGERSWVTLACDCQWSVDIEDPVSLRDLNERAQEHAEVCR